MGRRATLPVYDVEFIPVERRMTQRRSPLQQANRTLPFGDRRRSPGRRQEDWEAFHAANMILAS